MEYAIKVSQDEIDMLINATNIMHLRKMQPEMTEATRKHAKDYGDLCSKLYYTMMQQLDKSLSSDTSR